ncbi:MAG: hypothetical protein Q9167_005631 [Letrouitia subvulpina]
MAQRSEEDLDRYRPGGYHPVHLGDVFNDRYMVVGKLGYGQYSTVWLARDTRVNRHVALKILTAESYGGEKEIYELSILRHIKTVNPDHPGYKHVICLLDEFRHTGPHGVHVCLVFEVMGEDLVTLARRYSDKKLPIHIVKQVARQLFLGLDYLHRSCKVVHTDIQPRNIMIQLDNAESVIRDHLERNRCLPSDSDKHRRSAACCFNSEALTTEIPSSTTNIDIKIVDLGVGM